MSERDPGQESHGMGQEDEERAERKEEELEDLKPEEGESEQVKGGAVLAADDEEPKGGALA